MGKLGKYSSYKDSGVEWLGEIPVEWELTRLGTKFIERKEKVSDKDYEPLSVTKNGVVPQLDSAAKSNDGDNRKLVKKGDFVINSRSDRKGSSGISILDGSVSLIYIALEPLGINPVFCNYLLKSNGFIEEYYRNGHGIVADLWTTRFWDMKSIILGIPSIKEQTKIASFLDTKTEQLDIAIKQKEQLIVLLKERRQILINDAVTKGIDKTVIMKDSGIEWIGEIPVHWEIRRLSSIGVFTKGGGIARDNLTNEGLPAILYGDIYTKYNYKTDITKHFISKDTAKNAIKIMKGKILLTGSGETKEDIGKCIVYIGEVDAYAGGDVIIFNQNKADSLFLGYSLNSSNSSSQKMMMAKGEIIVHIYGSKLKELIIPLPPTKEEQQVIANYIEQNNQKIEKAVDLQQKQITKLKEYKTTLIDSVVTGKVRVE